MSGPLKIDLEASARLNDIDLLKRELGDIEKMMGGLAEAADALNSAGFGGRGRGGGGAGGGSGGGSGGGGRGGGGRGGWGWGQGPSGSNFGIGGFNYSTPSSLGNQFAQALGFGAVLAPGLSIRDALRFNMSSLNTGMGLGVSPAEILGFNRSQTGFGGSSVRYAYDKQQVFGGASALSTEAAFGLADKQKLYENTALLDPILRNARLLGLDPSEAGGLQGKAMKAFGMGVEQTDAVAQGFYKGAMMAQLPNRGDFMRQTAQFASQIRGMGGSFEEAISLVAGLNKTMPQQFKGEPTQDLMTWLSTTYKQYRLHGPGGFAPPMAGLLTSIFGSSENARQIGATKGISALAQGLIRGISGMYPKERFRERALASGFQMPDEVALMMDEIIRQYQGDPAGLMALLSPDALGKGATGFGADKEMSQLRKDRSFRAAQFSQGIENRAYNASTDVLGTFEGTLHGAIDALKGFTFWLAVAGGANVVSGALQGGGWRALGGMFKFGGGAGGGAAAAAGEAAAAGGAGGGGMAGLAALLGFGGRGPRWRPGSTITSTSSQFGRPWEMTKTLTAAEARAMNRAAAADAAAARLAGNMGVASEEAAGFGMAAGAGAKTLAGFGAAIGLATAAMAIWSEVFKYGAQHWNPAQDAIDKTREAARRGIQLSPDEIMENAMQSGDTGLAPQRKFWQKKVNGVWEGRTGTDWGEVGDDWDRFVKMIGGFFSGGHGSGHVSANYNDHSNVSIHVNSAREAAEVKKSIEDAKHKRFAQEQADRLAGVNASAYSDPMNQRNGAPGGLTPAKQM